MTPVDLSPTTVLSPAPDLVYREIAGEAILIPLRNDVVELQHLFAFNSVAGHIWQSIDGTRSIAELVSGVAEAFAVDAADAEQDVIDFVQELAGSGLVDVHADDDVCA